MLQQPRLAAIAAAVIATSPTLLLLGRQALDYVLPLPFVLGWLWCLLAYLDEGRARFSIAAGLLLGIGFYSYIAAWIFMPCCLAITWAALLRDGRRGSIARRGMDHRRVRRSTAADDRVADVASGDAARHVESLPVIAGRGRRQHHLGSAATAGPGRVGATAARLREPVRSARAVRARRSHSNDLAGTFGRGAAARRDPVARRTLRARDGSPVAAPSRRCWWPDCSWRRCRPRSPAKLRWFNAHCAASSSWRSSLRWA